MKKTLAIILTLCMLLATVPFCSAENSPTDVRISTHASAHGFPVYVAQELGYFEEEGLNVTDLLVYISAPPQFEAYEAGAWDIGTTGFGGIVLGAAKSDCDIIGVSIDDAKLMSFFVREDSDIATAGKGNLAEYPEVYGTADTWKGKEILLVKGTITELLLNATLSIFGISPDDVTLTSMDKAAAFTAFRAGSGDVVQGDASFYFSSIDEGWIPAISASDVDMYCPAVIEAKESFAEENPEAVTAFLAAYMKAVDWIRDNQDDAVEMMVEFLEENGVATTAENAAKFIAMQVSVIPTVEEQIALFDKAENGGTKIQNYISELMNYYVNVGNYTQENADALMLDENYDVSYLEAIGK